jgi:hypothetical protein
MRGANSAVRRKRKKAGLKNGEGIFRTKRYPGVTAVIGSPLIQSGDPFAASAGQIEWTHYPLGNHRLGCPDCGRGKGDKTLGLKIRIDGSGVAHCFRCNYVEVFRPVSENRSERADKRRPAFKTQQYETLSEYGQELFAQTQPLSGPALDYLNARRCVVPPEDSDLRYHPALRHPSGYVGPALIALVTDAATNQPITLHRTWIKSNGSKAEVESPRLLLGGHRKAGGVIRLWPDTEVTLGLGVCEGIETSLSLAHAFTPVWSLVDAGNLASFPVLLGIEALSIGADNDAVGMKAARKCARDWTRAGKLVRIVIPQGQGDLNDVAMETE